MRFLVGIGNPGAEYEWSRHNLGFMLIDKLAHQSGIEVKRRDCRALVGRGEIAGCAVRLVKPQTYMNLSGEAVCCLLRRYKVEAPEQALIVVSDDLALPLGKIRIRSRGSAGGHNGLKSIITCLGTNEFIRFRIGIQPEHPISDSRKYVLELIPRSLRPQLEETLERSVEAVEMILRYGVLKAMAMYNG